MLLVAATAFVAIFFFAVPFPLIILSAGLIGFFGARAGSRAFRVGGHGHGGKASAPPPQDLLGDHIPEHARPTVARALSASGIWLVLWLAPVIALVLTLGRGHVLADVGIFFSKMAVVTFGGAYAVLAYMAQQAVETYGWLKPSEMLDGLGMAETTPGPLIMVVQFVGFMAAFRAPGSLHPMVSATLGGLLATWCTFLPCFLWIGLGAPWIERLRDNKPLNSALAGITAAVVGVILNLAIWFALHSIFSALLPVEAFGLSFEAPVLPSAAPWALMLSVGAIIVIFRFNAGMIPTLGACSAIGVVLHVMGVI
jgi:chromate transporter